MHSALCLLQIIALVKMQFDLYNGLTFCARSREFSFVKATDTLYQTTGLQSWLSLRFSDVTSKIRFIFSCLSRISSDTSQILEAPSAYSTPEFTEGGRENMRKSLERLKFADLKFLFHEGNLLIFGSKAIVIERLTDQCTEKVKACLWKIANYAECSEVGHYTLKVHMCGEK